MVHFINDVYQFLQKRFHYFYIFSNITKKFLTKSPREKSLFFRKCISSTLGAYGCNFLDKQSTWGVIPAILQFHYFAIMIYTIFYYRNDPVEAVKATSGLGLYLPVGLIRIIRELSCK